MSVESSSKPGSATSSTSMLNHLLSTPSPYHHGQQQAQMPPNSSQQQQPPPHSMLREGANGGLATSSSSSSSPMTNGGGAHHHHHPGPPMMNRAGAAQPPQPTAVSGVVQKHPNVAALQQWQQMQAGPNGGEGGPHQQRHSPISPSTSMTSSSSNVTSSASNPYQTAAASSAGAPPQPPTGGSLPPSRPSFHPAAAQQPAYYHPGYGPRPPDSMAQQQQPPQHMYGGGSVYHQGGVAPSPMSGGHPGMGQPPGGGGPPPGHYGGYWGQQQQAPGGVPQPGQPRPPPPHYVQQQSPYAAQQQQQQHQQRMMMMNGPPMPQQQGAPPQGAQQQVLMPTSVQQQQQQQQLLQQQAPPSTLARSDLTQPPSVGAAANTAVARAKMNGPKESFDSHPSTPSGVQSPGAASSTHDDSMDHTSLSSPSWPHTPGQSQKTPQQSSSSGADGASSPSKSKEASLLDRLIGSSSSFPPDVYAQRRQFYDRLIAYWESKAQPITAAPTVSKQAIDLHSLYVQVRARGGFEYVTRQKLWKELCPTAVNGMAESSAAGYQLRRHYIKFLLQLECLENGRDPQELIEMAERQKKSKKKKTDGRETAETPPAAAGGGPPPPGYPPGQQGPPMQQPYGVDPAGYGMPPPPHGYSQMMGQPPYHRPPPWQAMQQGSMMSHPGQAPPPSQPLLPPGPVAAAIRHSKSQPSPTSKKGKAAAAAAAAAAAVVASTVPPPQQSNSEGSIVARDPFDDRGAAASIHPQLNPQYGRLPGPPAGGGGGPPQQPLPPAAGQPPPLYPPLNQQQQQPPLGRQQQFMAMHRGTHAGPSGETPSQSPNSGGSVDQDETAAKIKSAAAQHQQQLKSSSNAGALAPPPNAAYPQPTSMAGGGGPLYRPPLRPQMYATPNGGYSPYPPPGASQPPGAPSAGQQVLQQQPPQPYASEQYAAYQQQQQQTTSTSSAAGPQSQPPFASSYAQWAPGATRQYSQALPPSSQPVPSSAQGMYSPSRSALSSGGSSGAGFAPSRVSYATTGYGGPTPLPTTSASYPGGGVQRHPGAYSSHAQLQRQPVVFPAGSVEATAPLQHKRRRLVARDLPKVDAWRLVMSLKSDLDIESHWALNILNILLYDDASVRFFGLKTLPGLLDVLVNHLNTAVSNLFPELIPNMDDDDEEARASSSNCCNNPSESSQPIDADSKQSGADTAETPPIRVKVEQTTNDLDLNNVSRDRKRLVRFVDAERPFKLKRYLSKEDERLIKLEPPTEEEAATASTREQEQTIATTRNCVCVPPKRSTSDLGVACKSPSDDSSTDEKASSLVVTNDTKTDGTAAATDKKPPQCAFYFRECSADERTAILNAELRLPRRVSIVTYSPGVDAAAANSRQSQVEYLLCVSNVLRGLAFVPGNESEMVAHTHLLALYSRLLMVLHAHCRTTSYNCAVAAVQSSADKAAAVKMETTPTESSYNEKNNSKEATDSDSATLDAKRTNVDATSMADDAEASCDAVLYEAAVQLREDALVVVCLLSAHLDLQEADARRVAQPLCTGLLHWATCQSAEALDALPHSAPASPRHYALEALCKMSVLERNVDVLLATPPWPRLEWFAETLVDLLSMADEHETQCREFAVVLVNAVCGASVALSTVVALRTPAVHHLVAFLEYVDTNMHTVVQQQGMQALRENPELMGTSVGMLRRAAGVLQCLARIPVCRPKFARHQQRLLQFTMSQLMDSRVAGIIADTLFELHCVDGDDGDSATTRRGGRAKQRRHRVTLTC